MTTDQIKQCERESEQAEKRDVSNPCYGIERALWEIALQLSRMNDGAGCQEENK